MRVISFLLAIVIATSTFGCATTGATREQRQECRQARARAAGKAVGYTVGVVLVAAVFILAIASGRSVGNLGSRSRRRARRRGLEVCHETPADAPASEVIPEPEDAGPPSRARLQESFVQVEPSLRSCTGPGTLFVDADIDGADGRIVSYVLSGEAAAQTDRA
ncbi:MAG: hypothetical protein AAGE52_29910, partial [Myxococcota bacterium]